MTIIIDENLSNTIEELHYEVMSRKEILTTLLQTNGGVVNELFNKYQDDYKKYFTEYNRAKQEMQKIYEIPTNASWNLDFSSHTLTVQE